MRALVADITMSLHGIIAVVAHTMGPNHDWQEEFAENGGVLVLLTELSLFGHIDIASIQVNLYKNLATG